MVGGGALGGSGAFGGGATSRSHHGPQLPEVSAVGADGLGGGYFGVAELAVAVGGAGADVPRVARVNGAAFPGGLLASGR